MSAHAHRRTSGATYFLTLRLADRTDDLLTRRIDQLRRAMRDTLARHPFRIDAIAVLPSVIHTLWTLPPDDNAYQIRVALLKSRFSRSQPMPSGRSLSQIRRGDKGIWQRHTWAHRSLDAAEDARHRDLIHLSPVHAGLCPRPQDWPHSSLHRALRNDGPPYSRLVGSHGQMETLPDFAVRPPSAPVHGPVPPTPEPHSQRP